MSDSTEDLKNIDSYGVWVKRPPQDAEGITETAAEPAVNAEEVSIEEPVIPEDLSFDTLNDNDSTLSDEEVSKLKTDDNADDFFKDELPDFSTSGTEKSAEPEKKDSNDSGESEVSLDDFIGADGFEDPNKAFEPKTEDAPKSEIPEKKAAEPAKNEPADAASFEDGELSLDDFMDGGFSDSGASAPAGTSGSDEISLDDFFDTDTSTQKEDDVSNDEPLDIDLSFTENPDDKVPTEETDISTDDEDSSTFAEDDMFDNISAEQPAENETKTTEQNSDTPTEEVSLDDFGIDENSDDASAVAAGASVNSQAESEEVDLSDFGIDSDAGETPVKQDVHASKKKVVDYDIAITDDDSVKEAPKAEEVITSEPKTEAPAEDKNSVKVDSSMLDMIMQELSGLKNQINSLRDEFQTIKESKNEIHPEAKATEQPEAVPEIPEAEIPSGNSEQENTGFFDGNDNDETIALSGDELSNIMNTADISESGEEISDQDNIETPEELAEEQAANPEAEETTEPTESKDEPETILPVENTETAQEENVEIPDAEEIAPETEIPATEENTEIHPAAEEKNETPEDFNEESPFGTMEETNSLEEEPDSGLSMNSDEEKLEEPNLDEINMKNMEEEISIPKVDELADDVEKPLDDILVESSSSDLINSVDEKETLAPEMPEKTEEKIEDAESVEPEEAKNTEEPDSTPSDEENKIYEDFIAEDPKVSESISAENIDYLNEDKTNSDEEKTEEAEPADVATAEEIPEIEPEVAAESEEPELAETVKPEELTSPAENTAETETSEPNHDTKQLPEDLKNDVKSVLLYMDQLLENLPEDKIMEFAKSEQFTTYKKLFSELGLAK